MIRTDEVSRTHYSNEVRDVLEREFVQKNYVDHIDKHRIAHETGLTTRQIKNWFIHRRVKTRK
uniref:Homeobox domain-containing protein n=1 Tax=Helobdella robusta TaxID=6412 RepID=T1EHM5_HELRO